MEHKKSRKKYFESGAFKRDAMILTGLVLALVLLNWLPRLFG